MRRSVLFIGSLTVAAAAASTAIAGDSVNIVIVNENGVGSSAQAQPYVDSLVAVTAKENGWASAEGKYFRSRGDAASYIGSKSPHYGIMSLGAFLGLRSANGLEVVGKTELSGASGREYHLISKTQSGLAGCKGKTLATNHDGDSRFVDNVVSGGTFKLSDFTLVSTTRPVQTIKKVVNGDAECALIDDAQYAELSHIDGTTGIKSVWKSNMLPAMPVVAFPSASAAEKSKFQASLPKICSGEGKESCRQVGIQALSTAGAADYAAVVAAYGK